MLALVLWQIVILSLATAAISLTISKAKVTAPAREWLARRNKWLGNLVECPYCTSHWVAFALVALYRPETILHLWVVLDLLVVAFVIVALAALVCGVIIKLNAYSADSSGSHATNRGSRQSSDEDDSSNSLESLSSGARRNR